MPAQGLLRNDIYGYNHRYRLKAGLVSEPACLSNLETETDQDS